MAMLAEAIILNAARFPGVAAEDHRGDRLLRAREFAPTIGIHYSLLDALA
jgi:hypothetical protein